MEKTLNDISLLWNDIGLFNDISKLPSTSSTDYVHQKDNFIEELNYNENIITNKIENISNKWNILEDQIKNNENIIKLHENTIFNFSELTLKEILLHNNFKCINQNYNHLLDIKQQLNAKINRMESIYNNYNNLNLNEKFINSLPISSRDFDCKINDLIEVIKKIKSSIEFFDNNKTYYKSDFYKTKYHEQFKLLLQYVKLLLKNYFNGLAHFNTHSHASAATPEDKHSTDISSNKLIKSLERISGLLNHIKDEEDEMLQIEMYYINFRLQLLDANAESSDSKSEREDMANDIEAIVNHFTNLINLEMLYYNVLFGNILTTDQASVLVNTINNNFNNMIKVYFTSLNKTKPKNSKTFSDMELNNEKLRTTMVELNNYKDQLFNKNVNTSSLNGYLTQAENLLINNLTYFFNNFKTASTYPFDYSDTVLSVYFRNYVLKHSSSDTFNYSNSDLTSHIQSVNTLESESNGFNCCIHPLVYHLLIIINKYDVHLTNKLKLYKNLLNDLKKTLNDFGHFKSLKLSKQLTEINLKLFVYNNWYYFNAHLYFNVDENAAVSNSTLNIFNEVGDLINQNKLKLVQLIIEHLNSAMKHDKGSDGSSNELENKLNKTYNVLYNLNSDQKFNDSVMELVLSHFKLDRHLLSRNTEEADNVLVI